MPWEKQFNVDEARLNAMAAFWTHGYESTSMQDLLDAMGIQRGSFYDTFKSKHHVLLEALRQYDQGRKDTFAEAARGESAKQTIADFFQSIAAEARHADGKRGCLLVNCALELGPKDPEVAKVVSRAFEETENFFRTLIERGRKTGEIPKHVAPRSTAKALLGLLLGMRVLARAGAADTVDSIAAQAAAMLE
jgi:TetR/AcrR family transcriptional repressor of nem operon